MGYEGGSITHIISPANTVGDVFGQRKHEMRFVHALRILHLKCIQLLPAVSNFTAQEREYRTWILGKPSYSMYRYDMRGQLHMI